MKQFRILSVLTICFFLPALANAGGIHGKVYGLHENGEKELLAFATVFVEQSNSGATSNTEGYYKIALTAGQYDIYFQYLGYKSVHKSVQIGSGYTELDIYLEPISYELQETVIEGGREDPAVTVMRKAIAKAAYHRQQLDAYSAEVYIKGSGRILDVPFFLEGKLKEEGFDTNMAFNHESIMKVNYKRPNSYEQEVIAMRSSGKLNENSPMNFIFSSFYAENLGESVSPLSTKAFSYYDFQLVNTFMDGEYTINKIKVIPRAKGENVFWGFIYIMEDLWSIYSLNLNIRQTASVTNIQQTYAEVEKSIFLPINHQFHSEVSIYGLEFIFDYLATVSDYKVELNEELSEFVLIDEAVVEDFESDIEKKQIKSGEVAIDELQGKKIDRKNLMSLMKEYEKQNIKELKQENREDIQRVFNTEIDSAASEFDSAYWGKSRPVPLTEFELNANKVLDSIRVVKEKEKQKDSLKNSKGFHPRDLLLGRNYKLNEKDTLKLQLPLDLLLFNTVDGFHFGYRLNYLNYFLNNQLLSIQPEAKYNVARKSFNAMLDISYSKKDKNLNSTIWSLSGGRMEKQFNSENPIYPVINMLTTLLLERNYMRLYEKDFLNLNWYKSIKEKFSVDINVEYAERWNLKNYSSETLVDLKNREYASNTPQSLEVPNPKFQKHFAFTTSLLFKYKPWLKYNIINKQKKAISSSSPEFTLKYTAGLKLLESDLNFGQIELGMSNKFKLPAGRALSLEISAGMFVHNNTMFFPDYKHFMGNESPIVAAGAVGNYRLLEYYMHSTNNEYFNAHIHYHFRKFLLTQILPIRFMGLKENLFVNYLHSQTSSNYVELGYGLDNIFRFFRLEAIASFSQNEYQNFGIRVGIATSFFKK